MFPGGKSWKLQRSSTEGTRGLATWTIIAASIVMTNNIGLQCNTININKRYDVVVSPLMRI